MKIRRSEAGNDHLEAENVLKSIDEISPVL